MTDETAKTSTGRKESVDPPAVPSNSMKKEPVVLIVIGQSKVKMEDFCNFDA